MDGERPATYGILAKYEGGKETNDSERHRDTMATVGQNEGAECVSLCYFVFGGN